MNEIAKKLQNEVERREAAFVAKLTKAGLDHLVSEYSDLITLRNAAEVVAKKRQGRTSRANGSSLHSGPAESPEKVEPPAGFMLSDAVRDAIRTIGDTEFRVSTVYELLHQAHPDYVTPEKKGSISATLSNLLSYGELEKRIDGQRKVWYKAVRLKAASNQNSLLSE